MAAVSQNSCNQNQTGFQSLNNATGAMAGRTITAGTGIGVTNGDGVSGNPTVTLSTPVAVSNGGTGTGTAPTDGQILIGSTSGGSYTPANITAGSNISITNGAGSITIAASAQDLVWTEVTGTSQTMAVNSGYLANNAGLVTLTLPATAAQFTVIRIAGKGAGGWTIAQNAGQSIHFGNLSTTVGVTGSIASSHRRDMIEIICTTANTEWSCLDSVGNLLVT